MRNAFAREVTALAGQDPSIVLLSGDIGNRLFDEFKASFPNRFYNCGVAEANMIGVAAGLAMSGLRPVCYTITPFITYRCMEQIRVDVGYHHQPVIMVGAGAGLSYASLGATHHSCEEIGMLRLIPGLNILAPGDAHEVSGALKAALKLDQPVFLRIGKKGEPLVHPEEPAFTVGHAIRLEEGNEVCLLSAGNMLPVAVDVGRELNASVYSFHTIKPLDEACLNQVFARHRVVATIEEHSVLGGLGGAVAEWLADHPQADARLMRFGTADEFLHETVNQEGAREYFGLTAKAVAQKVREVLLK